MTENSFKKTNFLQKRMHSMGISMIVMGASFFLYYLGFFGTVEGPLTPATIGDTLAGMGVTKAHMIMFFLSFFIISLTWNHLYNLVSLVMGTRLTCLSETQQGQECGAATRKIKTVTSVRKTDGDRFKCTNGHVCADARFHPVKKGVISHTVWVAALLFCVIILVGS